VERRGRAGSRLAAPGGRARLEEAGDLPCLVHLEHRTDILDLLDKRVKSVVGLHERSLVTRGSVRYQERRRHGVQFRSGEFDYVCLGVHDSILHDPPSLVKLL